MTIKQGLPRPNSRILKAVGCVGLALLLAGCSSLSSRLKSVEVITQDSNFTVIRSRPGDTYEALAEHIYGTPAEAERIRSLNPSLDPAGTLVAVPNLVFNPSGVYPGGYRTIPILCYHQFTRANKSRNRLILTQSQLRQQLQYIADQGYHVIPMTDIDEYLQGRREIPPKSVVITIDDGYRSAYDIAFPLFKKYGFPATIFVYTDFVGSPAALTWQQMQIMSDSGLVDIQSHSKSHASLVALTDSEPSLQQVASEVRISSKILEKKLGHKVDLFSYPYGDSSNTAVELLKEQGVRLAVTVRRGGNPSFADPYLIRRTMIYADDNLASFKRKLQVFRQERYK